VLVLIAAVIGAAHGTDVLADHSAANLLTVVLTFTGVVTVLAWFLFRSAYRRRVRWTVLVCLAAGVAVLFGLFRVDHVSGELVPALVYRFSAKPDRVLEPLAAQSVLPGSRSGQGSTSVDLATATEQDFPQFLGPRRDASAGGVKLARDWAARRPELIWRHPVGAGWSAFSVVNGHAVTMEQRGDLEMVTCYAVATGQLEWAYSTPARFETLAAGVGPRSTPAIDHGLVYALGATGRLACLDGATGRCRWQHDLFAQYGIAPEDSSAGVPHGRSGSPLVVGDLVIVPAGGQNSGRHVSLAAFDKQRGILVWEGGARQVSYSSPALATLAGTEQILIVNEDTASGHDVKTGRVLWEYPWDAHSGSDPNVSQAVPVPPDRVLLSKGYGKGAMLLRLIPRGDERFSAVPVWRNPKVLRTKFTNVAIKDGYAYGLSDGILECVELAGGQRAWKSGRYGHGQILRVGDLILVLGESGELALVEATPDRANHVAGRFQALDGMTWNNLALYGPYLLVRNAEEAACYKLPQE
jgi:outer membrane protein assembly factor BamB